MLLTPTNLSCWIRGGTWSWWRTCLKSPHLVWTLKSKACFNNKSQILRVHPVRSNFKTDHRCTYYPLFKKESILITTVYLSYSQANPSFTKIRYQFHFMPWISATWSDSGCIEAMYPEGWFGCHLAIWKSAGPFFFNGAQGMNTLGNGNKWSWKLIWLMFKLVCFLISSGTRSGMWW